MLYRNAAFAQWFQSAGPLTPWSRLNSKRVLAQDQATACLFVPADCKYVERSSQWIFGGENFERFVDGHRQEA
jgi:hypothetical protein